MPRYLQSAKNTQLYKSHRSLVSSLKGGTKVESISKIIEKLESPLLFASSDSYRRLSFLKNLEETVASLLKQMRTAIVENDVKPVSDVPIEHLIDEFSDLFSGYDGLSREEQQGRIRLATGLIADIRDILGKRREEEHPRIKTLFASIDSIDGVGPRTAALLARKDIKTIEDIFYFLPRRYEDRRKITPVAETRPGMKQIVVASVAGSAVRFYGGRKVFEVKLRDASGVVKAKWFKGNESYLRTAFKPDARVILSGEITGFPFEREMIHPEFEILNDRDDQLLHFKRIVPIYSETAGLPQKTIRRIVWKVLRDYLHLLESPIPEDICKNRSLDNFHTSVRMVHFPDSDQDVEQLQKMSSSAHRRLIYDEFFFFQLGMALRKNGRMFERGVAVDSSSTVLSQFYSMLKFSLTGAQRRVIAEISDDMASSSPMNRLLQGDVGCGKTVVAATAAVIACANGYQVAIMAPTEILAGQHFKTISNLLEKLDIRIELLTGNLSTAEKTDVLHRVEKGEIGIVVGTHALIQDRVIFKNLGLAVIDEQHRFGVVQRAALRNKGHIPDVLVMTATPIPRTLAMTVYGDLDVSIIDEMPPGKIPPVTKVFTESQRARVYAAVHREVLKGNQVFIVYPLVEESESLDLRDAVRMAEHLKTEIFPDLEVGLVHGRMRSSDKEQVMSHFVAGRINILVATTVIEVGIDIPSASLIVVEHAERFGLSQLHQLRGRVGRGGEPSYCILLAQKPFSEDARKRLRIMEETADGFRIAEEDLAIRGPGEFMGTRQSGMPGFRVADIARDSLILLEAKHDAFELVNQYPGLESERCRMVKRVLIERWAGKLEFVKTG